MVRSSTVPSPLVSFSVVVTTWLPGTGVGLGTQRACCRPGRAQAPRNGRAPGVVFAAAADAGPAEAAGTPRVKPRTAEPHRKRNEVSKSSNIHSETKPINRKRGSKLTKGGLSGAPPRPQRVDAHGIAIRRADYTRASHAIERKLTGRASDSRHPRLLADELIATATDPRLRCRDVIVRG